MLNSKLKVLNLYAGIGGNRKLWQDVEVTSVEIDESIAKVYQDFFPNDKVIVADAHQYLLDHYKEFDFIWSSPPCPTHSRLGKLRALNDDKKTGSYLHEAKYPDMALYQEIFLLDNFFNGKFCIENVTPYYEPLIKAKKIGRHLFWTNFNIGVINVDSDNIENGTRDKWQEKTGFDISKYKLTKRKDTVLRNCVNPEIGLYILNCAKNIITKQNVRQLDAFEDAKLRN